MNEVTRHFCWYQNFVPCGLSVPALGLYTRIKSWKKWYKIRLLRDFFKLATNDRSDKMFLLTSKFHPQEVVNPCPGVIYMYKIMKKCIKSDFKKIFFKLEANDWSDKKFLLTSKFCPLGLSAPDVRLYTFINPWKDVYKVRGWRDSFKNLQQMTIVMRPSCWHQHFGPNGLSAPNLRLCLNFFAWITADFNISSALRWAIQDQWSSGFWLLRSKLPFCFDNLIQWNGSAS